MTPRTRSIPLALFLLLWASAAGHPVRAASAVEGMERVPFASATLSNAPDMGAASRGAASRGAADESAAKGDAIPPQELLGFLAKPDGPGPFPAVLLLHGCGGIQGNTRIWRDFFTARGYAVFAVDSFRPRGVKEICRSTGVVTWAMRAADAYGALDHLAAQPFIRRGSILVMGFSHGAGIALDVVSERRLARRPAGAAAFRAALALYPACGHKVRTEADYRAPVFIGIGEADDWTPARFCADLAARHRGAAVELRLYPGAAHSFDNVTRPVTVLPDVLNRNSPSGKGATVGGDPAALSALQNDLDVFLKDRLP